MAELCSSRKLRLSLLSAKALAGKFNRACTTRCNAVDLLLHLQSTRHVVLPCSKPVCTALGTVYSLLLHQSFLSTILLLLQVTTELNVHLHSQTAMLIYVNRLAGPLMLQGPTMDPRTAAELLLRLPHLPLRVTEHSKRAAATAEMLQTMGAKVRVVIYNIPSCRASI